MGVLQGQETSNLENNGSPSHISERQLQKTALQDEISDGKGSTTIITRAFRGQKF